MRDYVKAAAAAAATTNQTISVHWMSFNMQDIHWTLGCFSATSSVLFHPVEANLSASRTHSQRPRFWEKAASKTRLQEMHSVLGRSPGIRQDRHAKGFVGDIWSRTLNDITINLSSKAQRLLTSIRVFVRTSVRVGLLLLLTTSMLGLSWGGSWALTIIRLLLLRDINLLVLLISLFPKAYRF